MRKAANTQRPKAEGNGPRRFRPAPPWTPFPRDLHQAWLNGIASAVLVAVFVVSVAVCAVKMQGDRSAIVPLLVALAVGGALFFTMRALLRSLDRADAVARFFDWTEWSLEEDKRRAAAKKRGKGPSSKVTYAAGERAKASPGEDDDDDDEEPTDPGYWVEKLSERLARMHRFLELNAPEVIVEHEQKLIQRAIAKLPPAQALSVVRGWPKLRERFARDRDSDAPPPPKTTTN